MHRLSTVAIFALLSVAGAMTCHAQTQVIQTKLSPSEIITKLDTSQLALVEVALNEFRKKRGAWRCFYINAYANNGGVKVDFIPRGDVVSVGDNFIFNSSKCGRGVSYIIDRFGKIEKVTFSR